MLFVWCQEEILEKHLETAKRKQAAIESAATPDERVAMYAMKKTEAKVLQKQEVISSYQNPLFPFFLPWT